MIRLFDIFIANVKCLQKKRKCLETYLFCSFGSVATLVKRSDILNFDVLLSFSSHISTEKKRKKMLLENCIANKTRCVSNTERDRERETEK